MSNTFEQGWAARPFKEQFPELGEKTAAYLDRLNMGITDMLLSEMLTDAQAHAIRQKKFPKLVSKEVNAARRAVAAKGEQPCT